MSKQKHTPGPWVMITDRGWGEYRIKPQSNNEDIRDIARTGWHTPQAIANAQLIAAAPDLLTALEYAIWAHPELEKSKVVMDAIAKATGASK